jgi:CubicO group peptidase (beta-lactamase class C family)
MTKSTDQHNISRSENQSTLKTLAKRLTLLFAGILSLIFVSNISSVAIEDNSLNSVLESIRQKNKLPALAGAIVTSKGLSEIGAVGFRKASQDVVVTVDDKWHLGSETKAMTATLIGYLVEQNKLKWDSTLGQIFPEEAEKMNPQVQRITLSQLLTHRSGLPANLPWPMIAQSGSVSEQRTRVIKLISELKLQSEPGTKYEYSNLGYVVAGIVAEKVAGKSWEELVKKAVFEPLGMSTVGFGGTGTQGLIDQPWGHIEGGKPVTENGPKVDNPEVMGPAGTVHCSLKDWAKFVTDQLRGARGEKALLKSETYKKLHTPTGDYAFGWIVTERPWGGRVLTHAGSNTMNFAVTWVAPEKDFAVLVCTNQGGKTAETASDEAAGALILRYLKQANK